MAEVAVVQTSAVGVPVALDIVASTAAYQLVKLVDGTPDSETPIIATAGTPAAGTVGMVVAVKPGVSVVAQASGTVSVSNTVPITGVVSVSTGTVSISGPVQASGTVSVSAIATGTVSISGPVQVSGTVSLSGTQIVTLATGGTVATVLGTLAVSMVASATIGTIIAVSGVTAVSAVSTIVTILGTQIVTLATGGTVAVLAGGGLPGSTTGSSGMSGLLAWLGAGQTLAAVNTIVTVLGTQIVTLATGATIATLLGTVSVAGTVSVLNVVPVTTAASVSVTGIPVWLNPTQAVNIGSIVSTVNVAIVAGAGGGGSVTTASPNITATGQVMWMAGGQSTTAFPIYVSQINAPAAGGGSVTTASPNITATGQVMWMAGGQSTTAFPIYVSQINAPAGGGGSVTTAVPNITATGQMMWVVGGQSTTAFPVVITGTVTAGAGTTVVSISAMVPVTTQASVSVTGWPVWFSPGALVGISVSQALGTVITVLGTQVVTLATGATIATILGTQLVSVAASAILGTVVAVSGVTAVSVVSSIITILGTQIVTLATGGTVAVLTGGGLPGSTTGSSGMSGVLVWMGAGVTMAAINTIVTQLGTQAVTLATGGTIATLLGTQLVSVAASAILGTVVAVSGVTAVSAVSTIVTILGTQIVTLATGGSVAALDVGRTNVVFIMSSTSVGISGTMMLFTIYQGISQVAAGTTGWTVPSGKTLRVLKAAIVVAVSVTTSPVMHRMYVVGSTAAPTWVSTTPVFAAVGIQAMNATSNYSACDVGVADIAAGVTVGLAYTIATSGGSVLQADVRGYLFP